MRAQNCRFEKVQASNLASGDILKSKTGASWRRVVAIDEGEIVTRNLRGGVGLLAFDSAERHWLKAVARDGNALRWQQGEAV